MDGAFAGCRGKGQADWLEAGSKSLVTLGDYADVACTQTGDACYCFWCDNK